MPRTATDFVSGFESFLFPFRFPLAAVFNNISQGVCLFDASARIVACNASYIDLYGLSRDIVKPGCTLIELLRHRKKVGLLIEDPEQHAEAILESVKGGQVSTWLIETRSGRFIRAKNHPIAGGGWVTTHDDITDLQRAELATEAARLEAERARSEAQAAHWRLLEAFDVVPEGLALFDVTTAWSCGTGATRKSIHAPPTSRPASSSKSCCATASRTDNIRARSVAKRSFSPSV